MHATCHRWHQKRALPRQPREDTSVRVNLGQGEQRRDEARTGHRHVGCGG